MSFQSKQNSLKLVKKEIANRGIIIGMTPDFSVVTTEAKGSGITSKYKEKSVKILYSAKQSFEVRKKLMLSTI